MTLKVVSCSRPTLNIRPLIPVLLLAVIGCRHSGFPDIPAGFREYAYVANAGSNTLTILDLVAIRAEGNLPVAANPVALALSPTRPELYLLSSDPADHPGTLTTLSTDTNAITGTLSLPRGPRALSISADGHRAYIANFLANSVTVVDLDKHKSIATLPTGKGPTAALISPDDRTLLVTNATSGTVSLFSVLPIGPPLTLRATFSGCPGATSPVVLPNSSRAFVACSDGHQVLSLALALSFDDYNARQDPSLLTDHVLALLDVGRQPTHLTMKPDGGEIFVSNTGSDSISEIAPYTNEVGGTYPIGNAPAHGLISQDGSALWVANSGSESVSLYSILDGHLVSILQTGRAPDALALSADEHLLLAADTKSGDVALIRTTSKLGPALFSILPAGENPVAMVIKATRPKP